MMQHTCDELDLDSTSKNELLLKSYHRKMVQAAGRMFGFISFSFGLYFPAFTLRSRCFFMSSTLYKDVSHKMELRGL